MAQVLALGGQMPRRVESIPPAGRVESPKAVSEGLAENSSLAPSAQVRELSTSTPDTGQVAFVVRTMEVPPTEDSVHRESSVPQAPAEGSRQIAPHEKQSDIPASEPPAANENRPSPFREPEQPPTRTVRERRPETPPSEQAEPHTVIPNGKAIPTSPQEAPVKAEPAPGRSASPETKTVAPKDAMEIHTKPEAVKASPVRDMKFEVVGVDRRVEVRVSERHGEMEMTVRTPDVNLATTLRENLPALSTRLTESGFKSETWHPAAPSTSEGKHNTESSQGGGFQDSNTPPRDQHRESQEGSGQQHPKKPQEPVAQQRQKGRDFAWLMSSLR
jgi:hypothetical protein